MPRKKYGYTDDYFQFITQNYHRTVNLANPKIWAKISDEVKRNISYVRDITGVDLIKQDKSYWKQLDKSLKEKRKAQWLNIVRGIKLDSLNDIAVTTFSNALRGYDEALKNGFNIIASKLKGDKLTTFLKELPAAQDLYVAFGYSINKRSEAKRATGEANMVINSLKVWEVLKNYSQELNIVLPEYVTPFDD